MSTAPKASSAKIVAADGTTTKTVIVAGAEGLKVVGLTATSSAAVANDVRLIVVRDSAEYVLATASVLPLAGFSNSVAPVDLMSMSGLPGLPSDGQARYLNLEAGDTLAVKSLSGVSGAEEINVSVIAQEPVPAAAPSGGVIDGDGYVVQRAEAVLTGTDVSTTSTTWSNTGLSASITPKYANSIIRVAVDIPDARCKLVSGSHSERTGALRIVNQTDGVNGDLHLIGRVLFQTTSATADFSNATYFISEFAVDSLDERTFALQFRSTIDAVLETRLRIDDSVANTRHPRMWLEEIKRP